MPSETPAENAIRSTETAMGDEAQDLRSWIDARCSAGIVIATHFRIVEPVRMDGGWRRMIFAAVELPGGRAVTLVLPDAGAGNEPRIRDLVERGVETGRRSDGKRTVRPIGLARDAKYGTVVVVERYAGERLIDRMRRTRPMPFAEAQPLFEGLLETLAALHGADVSHGQLRPRDVFLEYRPGGSMHVRIDLLPVDTLPARMDLSEAIAGEHRSEGFSAFWPPVKMDESTGDDRQADVYAAAMMSYLALSGGVLPYPARDALALIELKRTVDPCPLAEALGEGVDPCVERFLARALARRPEDRFPSASEALAAWRVLGRSIRRRSSRRR